MSRLIGAKLASKSPSPLTPSTRPPSPSPPPLPPEENSGAESPYSPRSNSPPLLTLSRLSTPVSSPISAVLSPLSPLDPLSPYIWDTSSDPPASDTSTTGDESSTENQLSPARFNFHNDYPPRLQIEGGRIGKPRHNMIILKRYLKMFRPTETVLIWTYELLAIKIRTFTHRVTEMIWFLRTFLATFRRGAVETVRGWGPRNDDKILSKIGELITSIDDAHHLDVDANLVELKRLLGRERRLFRHTPKIYYAFNIVRNDLRVVKRANVIFMAVD